jgi:DNA-binding transcriptional LysR family regulator
MRLSRRQVGKRASHWEELFEMELKQLRHFLAVSELGSFSTAAVFLSVAQPVLSRQVRCLEEELGIEVLYRNGRGIVLTEAGEILHTYAKQIVDMADRAACEVRRCVPLRAAAPSSACHPPSAPP